jgi:hypothetical protein
MKLFNFFNKGIVWLPIAIGVAVFVVAIVIGGAVYVGTQKNMNTLSNTHSATIDASSLITHSNNPILSGTATGVDSVIVHIGDHGDGSFWAKEDVPVVNGRWSVVGDLLNSPETFGETDFTVVVDGPDNLHNMLPPLTTGHLKYVVSQNQSSVSVPGMSKYTDKDFGFSFWCPRGWKVITDSELTDTLRILDQSGGIRLSVVKFDLPALYEEGFSGNIKYFFDKSTHTWMQAITQAAKGSPDATTTANVSENTMGGLHMFPGAARFGGETVVPLSAHHFLSILTSDPAGNIPSEQKIFAKTIVATDPSVATPVSTSEQIKAIQAEKDAYAPTSQNTCGTDIEKAKAYGVDKICTQQVTSMICPYTGEIGYQAVNGCESSYLHQLGWEYGGSGTIPY